MGGGWTWWLGNTLCGLLLDCCRGKGDGFVRGNNVCVSYGHGMGMCGLWIEVCI